MFFYLSKILTFLFSPFSWVILFLAYSFLTKNIKRKKRSLITAFVMLLLFSNSFILDECMRLWEIKAVRTEKIKRPYTYGIILGGISTWDPSIRRLEFIESVDRMTEGIRLYREGKIRKIFISGGNASLIIDSFPEGKHIRDFLIISGIPGQDILCESESRNTRENALYTAKAIKSDSATYLLITSAYHLRRALRCFRKAGIHADPWSCDRYSGPRKFEFDHLFIPDSGTLTKWVAFIHELAGYCMYYVMGYI